MRKVGPYEVASTREVYRNPWIAVREDELRRPDGNTARFGVIRMKPGSSVLAITDAGEAVLVREFKYAVGRETLELISGGIEENEAPLEAAKRELREEAGFEASDWTDLGVIDPFTTVVESPNYMFLARGLRPVEKSPDPGEMVATVKIALPRAVQMVMASEIRHGASSVAILKAAQMLSLPEAAARIL